MIQNAQLMLIVEDNDSDFEAVTRLMRKAHIATRVVRCRDGDEALDYLHHRGAFSDIASAPRPDFILLDLNLPGTDGKEVLTSIKEHPELRLIPVIILSTSTDERDVQDCYATGANSYMTKRIDLQEFTTTIQRMSDFWLQVAILPKPTEPAS